jgi:hypothetical protein
MHNLSHVIRYILVYIRFFYIINLIKDLIIEVGDAINMYWDLFDSKYLHRKYVGLNPIRNFPIMLV